MVTEGMLLAPTDDENFDSVPPTLDPEEKFPVIIGTDVIYEPLHAELVANVVSRRLAPGGRCILCCGVRIQANPGPPKGKDNRRHLRRFPLVVVTDGAS